MKIIQKIHIVITLVLALSLFVVIKCCNNVENINKDEHATNADLADTIVMLKVDTIVEKEVVYKDKKVLDTIYIEKEQSPYLFLVQKHFYSAGLYDAWVSGIEPIAIDSINVYPKTEYRYVTQTNTIYNNKGTDFFCCVGFNRFNGVYSSSIGVYASTNRKWLYGAEIGLIDKSWYFGVKLGFNINSK